MITKEMFENEIIRAKAIISNVEKLGVDVSSFKSDLESFSDFYSHPKVNYIGNISYETKPNYKNGLNDINDLEKKLIKYEALFNVRNSVIYMNTFLESDLTKEKVKKASDEIITSLMKFETIDCDLEGEISEIKKLLIEAAYNVIKLEFIYYNHSKVLDFIFNDKFYLLDINEFIVNEIDNLISSINYIEGVNDLKMAFYSSKGLDSIYVNDIMFKLLVLCTNREDIKKNIQDKVSYVKEHIVKNIDNLNDLNDLKKSKLKDIERLNIKRKKEFKKLRNKIISFVLSGSIIFSSSSFVLKFLKKINTNQLYETKGYSISQDLNKVLMATEYLDKFKGDYKIILNVNNMIRRNEDGQYFVTNEKYDVTDIISKDEVDNCPNIDIDSYGLVILDSYEVARMSSINDKIKELYKPYYVYNLYEQEIENPKIEVDNEIYYVLVTFYILMLAFVLFIFGLLKKYIFPKQEPFLKVLKLYLEKTKKVDVNRDELKGLMEEVKSLLYENGVLREEFLSIPDEDKKLLEDYITVFQEIENMLEKNEKIKLSLRKGNN